MIVIERIAQIIDALSRCNADWREAHLQDLRTITREHLPRGAGIDSGTLIDLERSTALKILLHTSYHHMNDGGFYDGWTEHTITVTPSLIYRIDMKISGRDRGGIKDYLYDVYKDALTRPYEYKPRAPKKEEPSALPTSQNTEAS